MNCKWAEERVVDYLYGELSAEERQVFEEHLAQCPAHAQEVEATRSVLSLLREDEQTLGAEAPTLSAAVLEAAREQAQLAKKSAPEAERVQPAFWQRWAWSPTALAAAVAMLLVAVGLSVALRVSDEPGLFAEQAAPAAREHMAPVRPADSPSAAAEDRTLSKTDLSLPAAEKAEKAKDRASWDAKKTAPRGAREMDALDRDQNQDGDRSLDEARQMNRDLKAEFRPRARKARKSTRGHPGTGVARPKAKPASSEDLRSKGLGRAGFEDGLVDPDTRREPKPVQDAQAGEDDRKDGSGAGLDARDAGGKRDGKPLGLSANLPGGGGGGSQDGLRAAKSQAQKESPKEQGADLRFAQPPAPAVAKGAESSPAQTLVTSAGDSTDKQNKQDQQKALERRAGPKKRKRVSAKVDSVAGAVAVADDEARSVEEESSAAEGFAREAKTGAQRDAAGDLYGQARQLFRQNRCKAAIAKAQAALRLAPRHAQAADALFDSASCHIKLGQFEQARGLYRRIMANFPPRAEEARRALDRIAR